MKWIDDHVPPEFKGLVKLYLPSFVARLIYDEPVKEKRIAMLEDIPLTAEPPWARDFVRMRVMQMWKSRASS